MDQYDKHISNQQQVLMNQEAMRRNALQMALQRQAQQARQPQSDQDMSAIGKLIGALGNDDFKRSVHRFDTAPIFELLGMGNPREALPDWLFINRDSLPTESRSNKSPLEILRERFTRQAPPQPLPQPLENEGLAEIMRQSATQRLREATPEDRRMILERTEGAGSLLDTLPRNEPLPYGMSYPVQR